MIYHTLLLDMPRPDIAVVQLHRPDAACALNRQMGLELKDIFESLHARPLRAVIITGTGRHFCAGADLKERKGMDEAAWHAQHAAFEGALLAIMRCPVPVIAAVGGAAFGGGLELALACDFMYAGATARFALPEATLGIMPGLGGVTQLCRRIGTARAKELIYCGKAFGAQEALAWGVANEIVGDDELLQRSIECAERIAANAPLAVRAIKHSIADADGVRLEAALALEAEHYNRLLRSKDRHEGINAFNEKRKPIFTGE